MYHCNVCIYFLGGKDSLFECIKEIEPLSNFSHKFVESGRFEAGLVKGADLILADLNSLDGKDAIDRLVFEKKKEAEVILLGDDEQLNMLSISRLSGITDIWKLPMTEGELEFRFGRWQENYKTEKDFWQTRNYLDETINNVPHLIWYKDKDGVHEKVNKSFCKAVNKTMEQIEGRGHYYIWDITPEEYEKGEFVCMESEIEVMEKKETCIFDENVKIGDEMRMLKTYKSPLFDIDGSVMGTVGVGMDVTQERLYEQMILNNANTDFQTGLYNRRYIYQYVESEGDKPLTVYYLDLDNFKTVNDRYGHQEGDRLLLVTTKILQECVPDDVVARMGGDEFLVVQIGESTDEEAERKRKWLQSQLDSVYVEDEHFQNVSASIGTAYSPRGCKDIDVLIGDADSQMYKEKNEKKGR